MRLQSLRRNSLSWALLWCWSARCCTACLQRSNKSPYSGARGRSIAGFCDSGTLAPCTPPPFGELGAVKISGSVASIAECCI
ncbi:hypothetical protein BX667DRAFT_502481 [Coemansia mojavensis]|nr:hypothetical protein BX667DRAFT_502481 [Coemansia mojavensis]